MVLGVNLLWAIHVRDLTLFFGAAPMWFVVLQSWCESHHM
jgi:hypothetical protein